MPRKKFPRRSEDDKPTVSEFAAHDDLCTDILVDHTLLHTQLRKHRPRYSSLRGISHDMILSLVQKHMITDGSSTALVSSILQLPGVIAYTKQLHTEAERGRLQAHMKSWAGMYNHDCRWEITTTNRYTLSTFEAAATARATIRPGQDITHLTGTLVHLPENDETSLTREGSDFSVMRCSRTKASVIMLGPARVVNHDCVPNAVLHPDGAGIQVRATRNISVGQEITVCYGGEYFGANNCECLCRSCESIGANGWSAGQTTGAGRQIPGYCDTKRQVGQYFEARRLVARSAQHLDKRTPGDYVLTRLLLPLKYDKWTRCQVAPCHQFFVQREGHQTRTECHRCQRHRAIFQLTWPSITSDPRVMIASQPMHAAELERPQSVNGPDSTACTFPRPFISPAKERRQTRQGLRIEADIARLRGSVVDESFTADLNRLRRSRRVR